MVCHLRTPILNCFYLLLCFYFLTDSECSCLVMLAKPYPVSGPTYVPGFLTNTIVCQKVHMKCMRLFLRPDTCQFSK